MKRPETLVPYEKQRHDEYLTFKKSGTEKNRAHEIESAKMYVAAMRPASPPPTFYPEWLSHSMPSRQELHLNDFQILDQHPQTKLSLHNVQQYYEPPQNLFVHVKIDRNRIYLFLSLFIKETPPKFLLESDKRTLSRGYPFRTYTPVNGHH